MVMGILKNQQSWVHLLALSLIVGEVLLNIHSAAAARAQVPRRILLDTDVNTDDVFALLYILKLDRSQFDLKAVTINADGWSDAGHAVNHVYDLLFMMGRDDIHVGVGGEGGILEEGTILPNVGGYLPLIEQQGMTTTGYCRYRQAIPVGRGGGRLDIDTNFGLRKAYLPQGSRHYSPVGQPTAQEVMIDVISGGPTTVFLIGAHTNFAIFLMTNPHLKKNVEHIYFMGGGISTGNTTGCCPRNASSSCQPQLCGDPGNLFTDYASNPYAEYNVFGDPFAAYQVIHSGIPVTIIPLDATNTIPTTRPFYKMLEQNQRTYEAQYIFMSLKMLHDTWFDNQFFTGYYMWDSFMAAVASSIMSKPGNSNGENDIAKMEFMNITLVTSDKPYGISDGSNPLFDGRKVPKFRLKKGGVHSGHVQERLRDPFCIADNGKGKGKCKDGYTMETTSPEGVRVLVATEAKPSKDPRSLLDKEYFLSFLEVINRPQNSGKFNFTTQFPHYKEVYYQPDFALKMHGKPVIFDMDMSAGDFLALLYLLKVPTEVLDIKAILVTPTGWASAATIDVVYDLLHMMGRDDIPVGLGDVFAMNQTDPIYSVVGDCKYIKAIPHGSGGLIDSDTLYGLARHLPRSPRRYTTENSPEFGAPRETDHPELRQPSALDVWKNITKTIDPKITILTNGPLTTLAKIILSAKNSSSLIQDVYIVGGHINHGSTDRGNIFTIPSNDHAEFNMFLDPLAAKIVFDSNIEIKLIPLNVQRKVSSFPHILEKLSQRKRTPEVEFTQRLLSQLHHLQKEHPGYQHMDIFLGEILGAVVMAADYSHLDPTVKVQPIRVFALGVESIDGKMAIDEKNGKPIEVLEEVDHTAYFDVLVDRLSDEKQSGVLASFYAQERLWS